MALKSKLKWENADKGLCVVCDKPLPDRGSYRCLICGNLCEVNHKTIDRTYPSSNLVILDIKSKCCGADVEILKKTACSNTCHNTLVSELEKLFGKYKQAVDSKGIAYKVPTKYIIEFGLHETELSKFPKWEAASIADGDAEVNE